MKIVAVIPARAGSKGIPNKNIRLLGGRPLVSYAIGNAKQSEFITDIIVSTDSPEVGMIARQMGVRVHWRDESLCGDAVTLDGVIWDAVPKDVRWDYIITMQPTSPTLRVKTLDTAIRYAMENDLDTVLAAINAPHLSWSVKDGKKVPDYRKRLNRQYLPPHYMETGAFVISRASVVTPETRIGPKMDVFEIPEDESQDVDNFQDLISIAATLDKRKVGIYAEGADRARRVMELADEFYLKPDIYFDPARTDRQAFGDTKHNLLPVSGTDELIRACREQQYTHFVMDAPATGREQMAGLQSAMPKAKIACLDDDGEGAAQADLLIDARRQEEFYICPKPYLFIEPVQIREDIRQVMNFCGDRLDEIIRKPEYREIGFIAATEGNRNEWPELMAECDIAVTDGDGPDRELAAMGLPAVTIRPEDPPEERLRAALRLGPEERRRMQARQLGRELRSGRRKVMNLIENM